MVIRRCHGVPEGSPGVVSNTVRELQRCGRKGHVNVLPGRLGVLCHHTPLQTGAHVSTRVWEFNIPQLLCIAHSIDLKKK